MFTLFLHVFSRRQLSEIRSDRSNRYSELSEIRSQSGQSELAILSGQSEFARTAMTAIANWVNECKFSIRYVSFSDFFVNLLANDSE